MKGNHLHLFVRDLDGLLRWMDTVWDVRPTHQDRSFAVLPFGELLLVLDQGDQESVATLGFVSDDCDRDYRAIVERGAVPLEEPADRPWGVRVGYVRGPGRLTFEIEQPLR